MTPQEDSKPGRKRRDGNITYIRTQFATRVRSAIITLAKREAREAIKFQAMPYVGLAADAEQT